MWQKTKAQNDLYRFVSDLLLRVRRVNTHGKQTLSIPWEQICL